MRNEHATLGYNLISKSPHLATHVPTQSIDDPTELTICNKLEKNAHIANKKNLFFHMKSYYDSIGKDYTVVLPETFHVKTKSDLDFFFV
jgi:hypothetical protein